MPSKDPGVHRRWEQNHRLLTVWLTPQDYERLKAQAAQRQLTLAALLRLALAPYLQE